MSKPEGVKCPFIKMKPCVKDECAMYVRMSGQDPNTGEQINNGACSLAWMPTLHLESNQLIRGQGAATESLRNRIDESNKSNDKLTHAIKQLLISIGDTFNFLKIRR